MTGIVVSGLMMLGVSVVYWFITRRRALTKVPLAPATWVGFVVAISLGGLHVPPLF